MWPIFVAGSIFVWSGTLVGGRPAYPRGHTPGTNLGEPAMATTGRYPTKGRRVALLSTLVVAVASAGLEGCKGPNDTAALVRSGDGRACATTEVKQHLRTALTPFLEYGAKLKPVVDGRSTNGFGPAFDPVVAVSMEKGAVSCAATAYLSFDGTTPATGNTLTVMYTLGLNQNSPKEYTMRGNLDDNIDLLRILYENMGMFEK